VRYGFNGKNGIKSKPFFNVILRLFSVLKMDRIFYEGVIVRKLEVIEKDLREARETLDKTEGRDAEVYSRIVGYYRSVRNWNKGKKEEFGGRKMFASPDAAESTFCESCQLPLNTDADDDAASRLVQIPAATVENRVAFTETSGCGVATEGTAGSADLFADSPVLAGSFEKNAPRILLFVQQGCPSCSGAKAEAGKLVEKFGAFVETVRADTDAGLAKARKLGVTVTPTAILLRGDAELSRALDSDGIAKMSRFFEPVRKSA
jgi:hypothetical protein